MRRKFNLVFELSPDEVEGLPSHALGESIQTKTLIRLLSEIFPGSRINAPLEPRQLLVMLPLVDNAELGMDRRSAGFKQSGHLEMSIMKSANPMISTLGRDYARNLFSISPAKKVLSVYTDDQNLSELGVLISRVPVSEKPDVVFLSKSVLDDGGAVVILPKVPGYRMFTLSEVLREKELLEQGRLIIYNDSKGRMPEIYAASDFAVILAANNIFEPLQAKVPTIFFSGKEILGAYSSPVFHSMAKVALATGGAIEVEGLDEFTRAYLRLSRIDRSRILHPAFVVPKGEGKSAFTKLLDKIEGEVRHSLILETVFSSGTDQD